MSSALWKLIMVHIYFLIKRVYEEIRKQWNLEGIRHLLRITQLVRGRAVIGTTLIIHWFKTHPLWKKTQRESCFFLIFLNTSNLNFLSTTPWALPICSVRPFKSPRRAGKKRNTVIRAVLVWNLGFAPIWSGMDWVGWKFVYTTA